MTLRGRPNAKTGKPLSPKTVNLTLSALKTMLGTAVRWGLLTENPAAGLALFPLPERVVRYWTAEERDRFLRFARSTDPAFAELATVACFTGLRKGELQSLNHHNYCSK